MFVRRLVVIAATAAVLPCALAACSDSVAPLQTAQPGVVFAFPADGQIDVPSGARVLVTFSDKVEKNALGACTASSGAFCLVGPAGPIDAMPEVSEDGYTVSFPAGTLEENARYQVFVRSDLAPKATNLPSGPLVSFTTRSSRPRAAAPSLVAVNGGAPDAPDSFRPFLETSTIRLVFSEPLDARTIAMAAGSVELLDSGGNAVPATLLASDIHVSVDPKQDLTPGTMYTLRLGSSILDTGGQPLAPTTVTLTPQRSVGAAPIPQVLRTRQKGDPGPERSRSGVKANEIVVEKPLIGRQTSEMLPSTLETELADPKALGGPIAFTIRKGARLRSSNMDIALGGVIPLGLSTGEVWIELLSDAGGRMYRNPHQDPGQRPENDRAPLYVDLSMDIAVYAIDKNGNAALTQTVLGLQGIGTAIATEGVLAIETVGAMDMDLMGATTAPTNMVLELITDPKATVDSDTISPSILTSYPEQSGSADVAEGIDIVFTEPIDLDRARAGGIRLEDQNAVAVPSGIESHGSGVVVRPMQPLAYGKVYRVVFDDVADNAGNKGTIPNLSFTTPALQTTDVPMTVSAVYPGAACAVTGVTTGNSGRCAGGLATDSLYQPFSLPANDPIEIVFTQPVRRTSVKLATSCGGAGSVKVEEVDDTGTNCQSAVPGTLFVRERSLAFVPDEPWTGGKHYKVTLVSGTNASCDANELCGPSTAASFDPLAGGTNSDAGGPPLAITFIGAARTNDTHMVTYAGPITDLNGSGTVDTSYELPREENQTLLEIGGVEGQISQAHFTTEDCDPSTPEVEACMYMSGAMPVTLGALSTSCGSTGAAQCIPVSMTPQSMYGTSISMNATLAGIPNDTNTGTQVMRVLEDGSGNVPGYIVDKGGVPHMVMTLPLYMDAPDMSVPLSSHDLHSKALSVDLDGPMTVLADGRMAITLSNTADLSIKVTVNAPFSISGTIDMVVPAGQMHLQLLSPALRGKAP